MCQPILMDFLEIQLSILKKRTCSWQAFMQSNPSTLPSDGSYNSPARRRAFVLHLDNTSRYRFPRCCHPDIGTQRIPHDQRLFRLEAGDACKYIIKIFLHRLLIPSVLRDKNPFHITVQTGIVEAAVLGAGNAVGDNIQVAEPCTICANLLGPRKQKRSPAQLFLVFSSNARP